MHKLLLNYQNIFILIIKQFLLHLFMRIHELYQISDLRKWIIIQ